MIFSSYEDSGKFKQVHQEWLAQDTTMPSLDLTPRDVTRWKIAWREYHEHGEEFGGNVLVKRCRDWPDKEDMLKLPVALTFSATALAYGGLHALAWHAYFKSPTEQQLWRISACIVMGGMALILLTVKFAVRIIKTFAYLTNFIHLGLDQEVHLLLLRLLLLAYILARAYLVVECFINLAHLPAEVYDVPTWASYFPHIS